VGRLQSPIGLSDAVAGLADRPGRLGRSYRPAAASIVNRGHDIMVRFNSNPGGVVVDGVAYRLRQMHWHSPSEHAINGRRYALELHMLHQSDAGGNKYAVVAQLYSISRRRRDRTLRRVSLGQQPNRPPI
jgi:carbonic anhydrase